MDKEAMKQMQKQYDQQALAKRMAGDTPKKQDEGTTDELLDLDKVKDSLRSAFLGYTYETDIQDGQTVRFKRWRVENPYKCPECGAGQSTPVCKKCMRERDEKVETVKDYQPLCNEKALEDFFVPIEGIANINTAGSNLTDKQIESIGRNVMYAINAQIRENQEDYGIDSMADADQIRSTIRGVLMGALTKGREGWMTEERRKSRIERILNYPGSDDSKGKGWF